MDPASGGAAPQQSSPETSAQSPAPGVAQVLELPARPEEGGEWELLLAKLKAWWSSGEPQAFWQQLSKPLGGGLTLVLVLLLLQVYSAVVGTLESLPLLPEGLGFTATPPGFQLGQQQLPFATLFRPGRQLKHLRHPGGWRLGRRLR